MTPSCATAVDVLVMGAGFAGLCAAIKLDEDGERDLVVIEKGADVGGTWRDTTKPRRRLRRSEPALQLLLRPGDWSMSFSPQPEIQAYLQRVARDSGVLERVILDTRVDSATWDGDCARWFLDDRGRNTTLWPHSTVAFRGTTASFDQDAFGLTRRRGAPRTTPGDSAGTDPRTEQVPA